MGHWTIETKRKSDPVYVADMHYAKDIVVELRIGESKRGETRYADLTPTQARRLAVALIWAASGDDPDNGDRPRVMIHTSRKSKPKGRIS